MAARSKLLGSKMTFDSPARASLYVGVGGPAAARRCNSCLCFKSIVLEGETGSKQVSVRPHWQSSLARALFRFTPNPQTSPDSRRRPKVFGTRGPGSRPARLSRLSLRPSGPPTQKRQAFAPRPPQPHAPRPAPPVRGATAER